MEAGLPNAGLRRADSPLLDVRGLSIFFGSGSVCAASDLSFSIQPGEMVGIVGESGCGKSATALSLLRLLPESSSTTGKIIFDGVDLTALSEREMRDIRGRRIAMIFQEPMSALDPVFTVGHQISETIRAHFNVSRKEAQERAIDALAAVGIAAPRQRYDEYATQLSGGMRQRVLIAIALSCEPKLLVADEPTTALDVTVQAQIVDLLLNIASKRSMALMFITHDLGVVAESCTRVLTMYAGQLVEEGNVDEVLARPRHPYTSGLLRSLPRLSEPKTILPSIPGRVPRVFDKEGCRFEDRCGFRLDACSSSQPIREIDDRKARCCRIDELHLSGAMS
jgi:peptide/nickel transport system ATP-binding protein